MAPDASLAFRVSFGRTQVNAKPYSGKFMRRRRDWSEGWSARKGACSPLLFSEQTPAHLASEAGSNQPKGELSHSAPTEPGRWPLRPPGHHLVTFSDNLGPGYFYGRRRPHPRHWQALARIVGFSPNE